MNGLFKESTIEKISKIRKGFLWAGICLLIGGFALGAIVILASAYNETVGRIFATMVILTAVFFVGVNNFIRIEKGTKPIQGLALTGLISGIAAAILLLLLVWEVVPIYEPNRICMYSYRCNAYTNFTAAVKITAILISLAGAGFWLSNVLTIEETIKAVKPLKITSVVCESYCSIFAIVAVFMTEIPTNIAALSGFVGFAFVVTALAALIISKTSKNKQSTKPAAPKTEEELRAEIEEKVRREMIEKEVREKMGAEAQTGTDNTNNQSNPPVDNL